MKVGPARSGRFMENQQPTSNPAPLPLGMEGDDGLHVVASLLSGLDEAAGASPELRRETAHENHLVQVRLGIASALFASLRAKHAATASHCLRVALGCSSWAAAIGLSDQQRDVLETAALLHDVGKIGIPDDILRKPGRLTNDEYLEMSGHHEMGLQILSACCSNADLLDTVRYSRAWYDGSFSGFEKQGDAIPLGARMLVIADAFDAMTTDHVYRRAMSRERALAELFRHAGSQFDPRLVAQFHRELNADSFSAHADAARSWLANLPSEETNRLWGLTQNDNHQTRVCTIEDVFHEKLLQSMHDAVIFVDRRQQVLMWNRAAERLTGMPESTVVNKLWSPSLIDLREEHGSTISDNDCPLAYAIESGVQTLQRLTLRARGGNEIAVDAQVVPVFGKDGSAVGATLLMHDASSQISLEERVQQLHRKATRDPLTQLGNRAEFDRVLALFVTSHSQQKRPCALIICDIDHFKQVNDTYGHPAGDSVIVSFAGVLKQLWRPGDLVARYGGEEFVILCADCDNATATQRAEAIRGEISSIMHPELGNRPITASFGVTEIQPGDTAETMLRRADRALLQAKDSGRNMVVQLGGGLPGQATATPAAGWLSWFRQSPKKLLLDRQLITMVPLQVATEKLRGFIADHHAEIVSIEENRVILSVDVRQSSTMRRSNERAVAFALELQFSENHSASAENGGTRIQVAIRPKRNRSRRREETTDRARQLLVSIKSYLMAYEVAGGQIPGADADD